MLVLLSPPNQKLRCRHCDLVIDAYELADGHCPECYEVSGMKRREFEPLKPDHDIKIRYSCEQCGAIISD